MFNKPDFPSHEQLIAARDNVLAKHPTLRFIGAHLGSLEFDVDEVAARLARYPNFAVDISARLGDLAIQDSAKVRQFFLDYPDRILFGTDIVMRQPPSSMSPSEKTAAIRSLPRYLSHPFRLFRIRRNGRSARSPGTGTGFAERCAGEVLPGECGGVVWGVVKGDRVRGWGSDT